MTCKNVKLVIENRENKKFPRPQAKSLAEKEEFNRTAKNIPHYRLDCLLYLVAYN